MTTLDILVGVVVISGIISLSLMVTILIKLKSVEKTVKKNSDMLKVNESNMNKVVKLISILMKRTSGSESINLN
jgi:hypothetical protein